MCAWFVPLGAAFLYTAALALARLEVAPAAQLGLGALRPRAGEQRPAVEVVEGQRPQVHLVLLGMPALEVRLRQRPAHREHALGVLAHRRDRFEQILGSRLAAQQDPQQRTVLERDPSGGLASQSRSARRPSSVMAY